MAMLLQPLGEYSLPSTPNLRWQVIADLAPVDGEPGCGGGHVPCLWIAPATEMPFDRNKVREAARSFGEHGGGVAVEGLVPPPYLWPDGQRLPGVLDWAEATERVNRIAGALAEAVVDADEDGVSRALRLCCDRHPWALMAPPVSDVVCGRLGLDATMDPEAVALAALNGRDRLLSPRGRGGRPSVTAMEPSPALSLESDLRDLRALDGEPGQMKMTAAMYFGMDDPDRDLSQKARGSLARERQRMERWGLGPVVIVFPAEAFAAHEYQAEVEEAVIEEFMRVGSGRLGEPVSVLGLVAGLRAWCTRPIVASRLRVLCGNDTGSWRSLVHMPQVHKEIFG